MDINKIIDLLAKSNIDTSKVYDLISKASQMDLTDEENLKILIEDGCLLANKTISEEKEEELIKMIKDKGINNDLFSFLR